MLTAIVDEILPLTMVLSDEQDGDPALHPQATVYRANEGSPIVVVDLVRLSPGRYGAIYVPQNVEILDVMFQVYEDQDHLIPTVRWSREACRVNVQAHSLDSVGGLVSRVLGLLNDNATVDNVTTNEAGCTTSMRIRHWDSPANACLATAGGTETGGLLSAYQVTSTYGSNPHAPLITKVIRVAGDDGTNPADGYGGASYGDTDYGLGEEVNP